MRHHERIRKALQQFSEPTRLDAVHIDALIHYCENYAGLGWSLDHTGNLIEARIWDWPNVIGRYRPSYAGTTQEPLADLLWKALHDAHRNLSI